MHCGLTWPLGISTIFQSPLTVPLHSPNGRQFAVKAVQEDSERVYLALDNYQINPTCGILMPLPSMCHWGPSYTVWQYPVGWGPLREWRSLRSYQAAGRYGPSRGPPTIPRPFPPSYKSSDRTSNYCNGNCYEIPGRAWRNVVFWTNGNKNGVYTQKEYIHKRSIPPLYPINYGYCFSMPCLAPNMWRTVMGTHYGISLRLVHLFAILHKHTSLKLSSTAFKISIQNTQQHIHNKHKLTYIMANGSSKP